MGLADVSPLDYSQKAASHIYDVAWGQPWPHQYQNSISKDDVLPADATPLNSWTMAPDVDDESVPVDDDADCVYGDYACALECPAKLSYVCLAGMTMLAEAIGSTVDIADVLVVREEYVWLREEMEKGFLRNQCGIVVTGQPGIGSHQGSLFQFQVER
jgi:hypothetical protein